jgi:hypothetical protein
MHLRTVDGDATNEVWELYAHHCGESVAKLSMLAVSATKTAVNPTMPTRLRAVDRSQPLKDERRLCHQTTNLKGRE